MEKFLVFFRDTKSKINDIDKTFHFKFDKNGYCGNPFISGENKTYIWVEKLKKNL